jgi:hypothetical protein
MLGAALTASGCALARKKARKRARPTASDVRLDKALFINFDLMLTVPIDAHFSNIGI